LVLTLSHGGHLTHGSPVNFSGKLYDAHFYGVEEATGTIDYNKVRDQGLKDKTKNDYLWCICLFKRLGLQNLTFNCR
jgi:glycine/serine hydroxymethyltransferase